MATSALKTKYWRKFVGVKQVTEGDFGAWLTAFLPGRALLWEELLRAVQEHGWSLPESVVRQQVDRLRQAGVAELLPGVVGKGAAKEGYRCSRCGEEARFFVRICKSCGQRCATCEACLTMGRCRSCTAVVIGRGTPERVTGFAEPGDVASERGRFAWDGQLTPFQRQAAERGVKLVRGELPQRELLIHAVTGAGKTEITFPAIAEALRREMRVGVVTPRRDVVQELFPRLGQAFPQVPVAALFGGAPDRWAMAPLMVMTAHQALRFRGAFALLIVDEVDAFPFHHEPLLPRAVAGALGNQGRILYLTATPPEDLLGRVARGEAAAVTIPQRHHGRPLPVPHWEPVGRLRQKLRQGDPIPAVERLVQVVRQTEGRLLVFVPRVADVPRVVRWWQRQFADMAPQVDGIHAGDPERDQKVAAFRCGRLQVLVTTTILERGVTISRCHVLVLFADAPIFDAAALVQIAGRAGRDAAFPTGEVWFCSEFRTQAMQQACRQIAEMNRRAEKPLLAREEQQRGERGTVERISPPWFVTGRRRMRSVIRATFRWVHGEAEPCGFCDRPIFQSVDWQKGVVSRWTPGKPGSALCGHCLAEIVWLTGDVRLCQRCGRLLEDERHRLLAEERQRLLEEKRQGISVAPAVPASGPNGQDTVLCHDCRRWVKAGAALFRNRSVAVYSGLLREQWHAYKYGGRRTLETLWAEMLAYGWRCHQDELSVPDEIVYVPMHPAAVKERGFNQAQVLACGLAGRLNVPVAERLQRVSAAVRQSQQGREERLRMLDGMFRLMADGERPLAGKQVLLVDDIYTTGSTLEACARLLRQAGAQRVVSLTLARA